MESNIDKILVELQGKLKAPKDQYNDFAKFAYRSCESILEALKPHLRDLGASVTMSDKPIYIGAWNYIEATVTLRCGSESISVTASAREQEIKKGMDAAQISGAVSSYARKYALNGMFAIDDTKDADSMDNSTASPSQQKPPAKQTTKTEGKEDKGWFNKYPQYEELKHVMVNKLISGETKSTDDIIRGLTGDGWKINKEVRELIKGLAAEAAAQG